MYSLEVWKQGACRVLGATGLFTGAQQKAQSLAEGDLTWIEKKTGTWEALGVDGSRYIIIEHIKG